MKQILIVVLFGVLMQSCNDDKKNSFNNEPNACYRYASLTDTISLKLIYVGESITGTLVYKLHEKDKNMGTILGFMRGDVLVADYTFMSEGVQSVREVAFKKDGNYFVEGYGEMKEINNRMIFNNTDSLRYNEKFKLSEIKCE
jgi:hypothetical protein